MVVVMVMVMVVVAVVVVVQLVHIATMRVRDPGDWE